MAKIKALPRWSSYRLWLAQCGRRLWLSDPPKRLHPPETPSQIIGQLVHQLIALSVKENRRLSAKEIMEHVTSITQNQVFFSHVIKYLDVFYALKAREQEIEILKVEKEVEMVIDNSGHTVTEPQMRDNLSHVFVGRIDALCRKDRILIIRDFKTHHGDDVETVFRSRTQFGIYRICLRPMLNKYDCDETRCEVVDLSTGQVTEIIPFDTGEIFRLVKQAEKRSTTGRGVSSKRQCPGCPYKPICAHPDSAPVEWKQFDKYQLTLPS